MDKDIGDQGLVLPPFVTETINETMEDSEVKENLQRALSSPINDEDAEAEDSFDAKPAPVTTNSLFDSAQFGIDPPEQQQA